MYLDPAKYTHKTKINSQLTERSAFFFACSKQKLGILTNMQDPYVSRTSIDTLSPTNWLKIKVLLGYVFLSRGRTGVSVVGDWLFINALLK